METFDVYLSELLVGHITRDDTRRVSFRFTEQYIRMSRRPVVSQSFEDDLTKTYRAIGEGLPVFFANLIPEGPLRQVIERSLQLPPDDDLAFLVAVGRDLPGAVEVVPGDLIPNVFEETDPSDEIGTTKNGTQDESLMRFSLAGVQMKFSVLAGNDNKVTIPVHGNLGEWILKLDSRRFPRLSENEYATLQWARSAGFTVPDCKLLDVASLPDRLRAFAPEGSSSLLIRRYDRSNGKRIHQEDFAQAFERAPRLKYADDIDYEQCAFLVEAIAGANAYNEFIRRLVFMVATGNVDAHLKNWSFLYEDSINARLAPLYDQVTTVAWPDDLDLVWALRFGGRTSIYETAEEKFAQLARRAKRDTVSTLRVVTDTIIQIVAAWHEAGISHLMPDQHRRHLQTYWSQSPLLRPYATLLADTK